MITGAGDREHDLAPAIGDFGKAVEQQNARFSGRFEAGFENVHPQAVDALDKARAYAFGKRRIEACLINTHLASMIERCMVAMSPGRGLI